MAAVNPQQQQIQDAAKKLVAEMTAGELFRMHAESAKEERARRAKEHEEEWLRTRVQVEFLRPYHSFNRGERAGLMPKDAKIAIEEKFARRVGGTQPAGDEEVAQTNEEAENHKAKIGHLVRFIGSLDEDDKSLWDDSGLPKVAKLGQMLGMSVSDAERNEAWKLFQAGGDAEKGR